MFADPDLGAVDGNAQHGTGIGAMGDDFTAIIQGNIGKKTLIPHDQPAAEERGGKAHGAVLKAL